MRLKSEQTPKKIKIGKHEDIGFECIEQQKRKAERKSIKKKNKQTPRDLRNNIKQSNTSIHANK